MNRDRVVQGRGAWEQAYSKPTPFINQNQRVRHPQPLYPLFCLPPGEKKATFSLPRGGGEFLLAGVFPEGDVGLQILHHVGELVQVEGLRAVADGFLWSGMRFDD